MPWRCHSPVLSDVSGRITLEDVRRYQADASRPPAATSPTRLSPETPPKSHSPRLCDERPQVLVAALAMKFRAMAKGYLSVALRLPQSGPLAGRRARRELRGWLQTPRWPELRAIATADAETKGASRDNVP